MAVIHKEDDMISLETVVDYDDFHERFALYQQELMEIQGKKWDIQTVEELKAVKQEFPTFEDVYIKKDREIVGFICFERLKGILYVNQFYVAPSYRRQGIGTKAVGLLVQEISKEDFILEILDKNEIARKFWSNTLKGYKMVLDKQELVCIEDNQEMRYTYRRE